MRSSSSCVGVARRGWRYLAGAPTVAVDASHRLRCASRSALAWRNSLHSLRSLRSNNRRESNDEARALRAPSALLRCSPPHKSPPPGTAHRAETLVLFGDACHGGAGKAVGGSAPAATYAAPSRPARTRPVQWTGRAWRAAGPQGPVRPARPERMAARTQCAPRVLTRRDCSSEANAVSVASFSAGHAIEQRREPLAQRGAAASERRRIPARGFARSMQGRSAHQ